MALNPPTPGLRHIHHDSVSYDKVTVSVAPDEHLFVSDDVAEQLTRASNQFKDVTGDKEAPQASEPVVDEPVVEPVVEEAPKPRRKRAASKKG